MTNADIKPINHAHHHKNNQRHPNSAPVHLQSARHYKRFTSAADLYGDSRDKGQHEQPQKRELRLQKKQDGKIEPDTVWVDATKYVGRPADGGEGKAHHALEIEPRGHEHPAECW